MAQTLFKATGMTADTTDIVKDSCMKMNDVRWVNVNNDTIVITHDDGFDEQAFVDVVASIDANIVLNK